jgi:hypothetical protein
MNTGSQRLSLTLALTLALTACPPGSDDADGDGYPIPADCDDASSAINPGAEDIPYNGIDEDCDGSDLDDLDGDGARGGPDGGDCDDEDPAVLPGGTELCNGYDDNCNAVVDEGFDDDGDGVTPCGADGVVGTGEDDDCDDGDAGVFPGNSESCDNVDNDCDGAVDEGFDDDGDDVTTCGPDGDAGTSEDNDCDDSDSDNFPGNPELVPVPE